MTCLNGTLLLIKHRCFDCFGPGTSEIEFKGRIVTETVIKVQYDYNKTLKLEMSKLKLELQKDYNQTRL